MKPVAFSPELASDVIEATRRVLGREQPRVRPGSDRPLIATPNVQWVRVSSTTVTNGRQAGYIVLRDSGDGASGSWTDGEAIKVVQVNGYVLDTGKKYQARMSGYTAAGDMEFVTGEVAANADNAAASFVRFTLPSSIATTDASKSGCTVDGYWGGPAPSGTITVYNLPASSNYIFSGASGHKGLAAYDDVNAKYWIVQMECP